MKKIIFFLLLTPLFFGCSDDDSIDISDINDINVVLAVAPESGTPTAVKDWPIYISATLWNDNENTNLDTKYYIHIFHQEINGDDDLYYYDESMLVLFNQELNFTVKAGDIYSIKKSYNIYAIVNKTPSYNNSETAYVDVALPDYLKYTLEIYRNQ